MNLENKVTVFVGRDIKIFVSFLQLFAIVEPIWSAISCSNLKNYFNLAELKNLNDLKTNVAKFLQSKCPLESFRVFHKFVELHH